MRAIFIDPYQHTVEEIVYTGDWKTIGPMLDADCFTIASLDNGDAVFVDDEGLFTQTAFFRIEGYHEPLAGRGLILGTDDEGDSISPAMTLEQARKRVRWVLAL